MEASPLYRQYQWRFATRKGEKQYLSDCFKSSTRKYSTGSSSLNFGIKSNQNEFEIRACCLPVLLEININDNLN
jgi:hypothetical protein